MAHCIHPVSIHSPYTFKLGQPWTYPKMIDVPCGKCFNCLENRKDDWKTRLKNEVSSRGHAYFCTVTYDEDHLPYDDNGNPTFRYLDFQLFMKRLRKRISNIFIGFRISYFVVSEYGDKTGRPHYHFLLFGLPRMKFYTFKRVSKHTGKIGLRTRVPDLESILLKTWQNGTRIEACMANPNCISYMVDYMLKPDNRYPERMKPFYHMSSRPFIGYRWWLKNHSKFRSWNYRWRENKYSHSLPRTYLRKFFEKYGEKEKDLYRSYCYDLRCKLSKEFFGNYREHYERYVRGEISEIDFNYCVRDPVYIAQLRKSKLNKKMYVSCTF